MGVNWVVVGELTKDEGMQIMAAAMMMRETK